MPDRHEELRQALRESEERHRLIVESALDYAIFVARADGRIDSWSPGAEAVFGWKAEEAIGQPMGMTYTLEDQASGIPEQEVQMALQLGVAPDVRWHMRKDGSRIFIDGTVRLLDDSRRGDRKVLKIGQDVTHRKVSEEALHRMKEQLEARIAERTRELAAANEVLRQEMADRSRAEAERVELLRQLATSEEDERRRISRDLHDQLGQQITAVLLKLSVLKNADRPPAREQLEELEKLVLQLDDDLDFIVWELRPTVLDDLGLPDALTEYSEAWSKHFRVPTWVQVENWGDQMRLPTEVETALYRIAQEALNNVAKHARAREVEVVLRRHGLHVELSIRDDGVGFEIEQPIRADGLGLGLVGMRERASRIGGTIAIDSGPGDGTAIAVRAPIEAGTPRTVAVRETASSSITPRSFIPGRMNVPRSRHR